MVDDDNDDDDNDDEDAGVSQITNRALFFTAVHFHLVVYLFCERALPPDV